LSAYAASHHVGDSTLAANRAAIDRHFSAGSVPAIVASLKADGSEFAVKTLEVMATRSPLMMCVTHELIQRGAALDVAACAWNARWSAATSKTAKSSKACARW
jgi:hypothetical protein